MKIVGHRGARALAPENTLASIQIALDLDVDMVEIDVRVTHDGIAVLSHDNILVSQAHSDLTIASSSFAELKKDIPALTTLEEAIRLTNRRAPMIIEVKSKVPVGPVVAVLKKFTQIGWSADDFIIGSKSQRTLVALHAALPDMSCIVIHPWSGVIATYRARKIGTNMIAMNRRFMWSGFIHAVSRNYQLYVYTLDDPAKMKRWEGYGLAGVITDRPDIMKSLMHTDRHTNRS